VLQLKPIFQQALPVVCDTGVYTLPYPALKKFFALLRSFSSFQLYSPWPYLSKITYCIAPKNVKIPKTKITIAKIFPNINLNTLNNPKTNKPNESKKATIKYIEYPVTPKNSNINIHSNI
jgi:hypothetical protein